MRLAPTGRATRDGVVLAPLDRRIDDDAITYPHVGVDDRARARPRHHHGAWAAERAAVSLEDAYDQGADFWPLAMARELDDAILHLRFNEPAIGLLVLRTEGDAEAVLGARRICSRAMPTTG